MPDTTKLTNKQRQIYEFIRTKVDKRGIVPTIRDIGKEFSISSPNGVMCHLKALEKKGMIKRKEGLARAIELVDYEPPSGASLPMLGKVAAGPLMAAERQDERLDLGGLFVREGHFALQVKGNSMIEDHIEDGDYVVIRKENSPMNGERVVARVDGEVTLKRFYQKKDHIRLEPANSTMNPIIVEPGQDVEILGVLAGVLRKC